MMVKLHQSIPKPLYYYIKYPHIFILLYLSRTLWCFEIVVLVNGEKGRNFLEISME